MDETCAHQLHSEIRYQGHLPCVLIVDKSKQFVEPLPYRHIFIFLLCGPVFSFLVCA